MSTYFKHGPVVQEEISLKDTSIFSSVANFVQRGITVCM